jgi:hypothetical protein
VDRSRATGDKEQVMLDPKEQAKGGFRAFAAREQERKDVLAGVRREEDAAEAAAAAARVTAEGQADGSQAVDARAADDERSPYAPPADQRPQRSP